MDQRKDAFPSGNRRSFYLASCAFAAILFMSFAVLFTSPSFRLSGAWPNVDSVGGALITFGNEISKWMKAPNSWLSMQAFVREALENDIYPKPYNGTGLRELCERTVWQDGVFLNAGLGGGIGNVRPGLMASIRVAIESGAGLILPRIYPRIAFAEMSASFDFDPSHSRGVEYLFDVTKLHETLRQDCPQLVIIDDTDEDLMEAWNLPDRSEEIVFDDKHLVASFSGNVILSPEDWRPAFDWWLNETLRAQDKIVSPETPVRVWMTDPAFFWPVAYDGAEFAANFARVATSPRPLREVAARVLYRLYRELDIREAPGRIPAGGFLGLHLRTEGDARAAGFAPYEEQRDNVVAALMAGGLSGVYVATGDAPALAQLRQDLAGVRVPVNDTHSSEVRIFSKVDLLAEESPEAYSDFTWDQMALVDVGKYLLLPPASRRAALTLSAPDVMLRASKFVGISQSSWSWTLALRRHIWSNEDPYDYEKHPVAFQDEFSTIFGAPSPDSIIAPTLWPRRSSS